MAIAGRLEDLSAADALQFMHMSARSGQLTFESAGQRAWLAMRDGRITGASLPGRVPQSGTLLGAFGANGEVPISQLVVGMKLNYAAAPVLRSVVETGRAFRGSVNPELIGCAEPFERVGRPRTGHAMFLPVRGVTRVFAALYLDNGSRTVPLVSTEALQILSAHAGLMQENLALQRTRSIEPRTKVVLAEAADRHLPVGGADLFIEAPRSLGSGLHATGQP